MVEKPCEGLAGRLTPERARAVVEAHPLRWRVLERHAVAIAVLVVVAMMLALQLDRVYSGSSAYGELLYGAGLRAVLCSVLVWLVAKSGLLGAIGLTSRPVWRSAWLWWLPVVLLAVLVLLHPNTMDAIDAGWLGLSAVNVLFVGFLEELVVRGVALFLLVYAWREREYGVVAAVLASSALFGLAHIVNSLGSSAPWSETLPQIAYAFLIGVGLAALVLRTNTLWIGILWHAAFDFVDTGLSGPPAETAADTQMATATAAESAVGSIALFLVLLVYGLVLVRRRKPAAEPVPSDQQAVA